MSSREPYIVSHCYQATSKKACYEYTVRVWHLSGEEYFIHPAEKAFVIQRFDGEKPILELDIFPCEYLEQHSQRKVALIERDQRFFQLRRKKCMYFDGGSDITISTSSNAKLANTFTWNGLEIRNAYRIAVSLAQAEGTKEKKGRFVVKRDHIKVTVELSKEFKNYMVSMRRKNESQRAQLMEYPYDAFNAPPAPKQEYF
ncbi:hypothetical protein P280DRAFT_518748 [Massarina eburnea CBS 473.64]|uniref:Uncharacterized protein n=1 Tax=Massarina eburnea CBS 473.64 TaxID=1395130 RepID=A0A6A6RZ01_9PLEO|nr:hypothetical protein P280DRAFT_518748 [Massarina eburnea CBS 473.64]